MGWPGPMTHRQFLTWMRWLEEEDNHPSRTDNYLMQIAAEVCRVLHRKPETVKLSDFVMKFKRVKPMKTEEEKKKALKESKRRWWSLVSGENK